jgi:hypothetical protein
MSKHALYLVTYSRGIHPITGQIKPHHWAYFLETNSSSPETGGVIFQLRGMPGGFHYPGPEQIDVTQDGGPGELRDKLEVGEVEVDGADVEGLVAKIHGVLEEVPVVKDESAAWNCQDWAVEGFMRLRGAGVVYGYLEAEDVRGWLRER